MRTFQKSEIQAIINTHRGFSDCIIEEFKWKHFGTTMELKIRYIYDQNGHIPKSMDDWHTLVLSFHLVQKLRISNALTQTMCNEPERLNWGFNEIALIKLEDNPELLTPFKEFITPFHHIVILWESERRIDIVFSELEIPEI